MQCLSWIFCNFTVGSRLRVPPFLLWKKLLPFSGRGCVKIGCAYFDTASIALNGERRMDSLDSISLAQHDTLFAFQSDCMRSRSADISAIILIASADILKGGASIVSDIKTYTYYTIDRVLIPLT